MPSRRLVLLGLASALGGASVDAGKKKRRKRGKKGSKKGGTPSTTTTPIPTCTDCLSCESCVNGTCRAWPNYVSCGNSRFCINGACAESCAASCSGNRLCRLRPDDTKVCALQNSCEDQPCGRDADCGRGEVCTVNMCGAGPYPTGICARVA